MKKIYAFQRLKMILLFILTLFVFHGKGLSQKNTIKITPVKFLFNKVNISYERSLNKEWSIIADTQFWFLKDKERRRKSVYNSDKHPILESNRGIRMSLELRGYYEISEYEKMKINLYYGLAGFFGKHEISMKTKTYSYEDGRDNTGWLETLFVPKLSNDVDMISGGTYANVGFQLCFRENFKIETGVILGRAWINQVDEFLTLFNAEHYVLESEMFLLRQDYSMGIVGFFIEPRFLVAYSF